MNQNHISVCVCTYRRPEWLRRLLRFLQRQETGDCFTYSIVVADNDPARSARDVVAEFATARAPTSYCVEPIKNIALARNRAIANATGDWIALIDDDEYPIEKWLAHLFHACQTHQAAGVLGPVRSDFEVGAPTWVRKCGLYDRPEHVTGFVIGWRECRTGNVLFRRDVLRDAGPPFAREFANGGEDQDFFRRMMDDGHRFVWCQEAVVYETVPSIRWNKKVLIRRALLRGQNSHKHPDARICGLLKSLVALAVYGLALPFLALGGTHWFMRYLIKCCDHLGKLLAAMGINPVRSRAG